MKNFLSTLKGKLIAVLAGLALVGGLVYAQTTFYVGYNALSTPALGGGINNSQGLTGSSIGPVGIPVVGGGTACGTATQLAGDVWSVVTTATTSACQLTFPYAAPHGYICTFFDQTTPADTIKTAAFTTTTCAAVSGTTGSADTIYVLVEVF